MVVILRRLFIIILLLFRVFHLDDLFLFLRCVIDKSALCHRSKSRRQILRRRLILVVLLHFHAHLFGLCHFLSRERSACISIHIRNWLLIFISLVLLHGLSSASNLNFGLSTFKSLHFPLRRLVVLLFLHFILDLLLLLLHVLHVLAVVIFR